MRDVIIIRQTVIKTKALYGKVNIVKIKQNNEIKFIEIGMRLYEVLI